MKAPFKFIKRGFLVYSVLSLIALAVIIGLTSERKTWTELFQFDHRYLLPLLAVIFLRWYFDGLSLKTLVNKGSAANISVLKAVEIKLKSTFVSTVMPMLLSSVTVQTYLLYKEKISLSEGFAISSLRAVLPIFLFMLFVPLLFFIGPQVERDKFFVKFVSVASIPIILSLFFFVLALFLPNWIKKIVSSLITLLLKIRILKTDAFQKARSFIFNEIDDLSVVLKYYLSQKKRILFLSEICIAISFLMEFAVASLLLLGLRLKLSLVNSLLIQWPIKSILYFAPTPGGSGFNEFSYMGFFSIYAPQYLVGMSVFIWRFLTAYLWVIVGGIILIRSSMKGKSSRI